MYAGRLRSTDCCVVEMPPTIDYYRKGAVLTWGRIAPLDSWQHGKTCMCDLVNLIALQRCRLNQSFSTTDLFASISGVI